MGAPTKLRLVQASAFAWKLIFRRADNPAEFEDLAGATWTAFIKRNAFDADSAALKDISARVTTLSAGAGEAVLFLLPGDTADLDAFASKEWHARATLAGGRVVALEQHRGPLVFAPLTGDPEIAEPDNDFVKNFSPGSGGTPTPLPAYQITVVDLAIAAEGEIPVNFGTAYGAAPRLVIPTLEVPDGEGSIEIDVKDYTAGGCTLVVRFPVPAAGYRVRLFSVA